MQAQLQSQMKQFADKQEVMRMNQSIGELANAVTTKVSISEF